MKRWFERAWYTPRWQDWPLLLLLSPLSLLFCLLVLSRRAGYRLGIFKSVAVAVPLVVVGNITVGGSGKTPLVIALVQWLRRRGFQPAVISRGYGRRDEALLCEVTVESDPTVVGDEPLLIAKRAAVPVYVCADRMAAAQAAVKGGANIILSDDGLQHYRMQRTVELAVVDAVRQLGNRLCLPAGPLREPPARLKQMDIVLVHGGTAEEPSFRLQMQPLYRLDQPEEMCELKQFQGQTVHAVAGIGNPQRFFVQLEQSGVTVIPHPFSDHHQYNEQDIRFEDELPLLMTEKDAVKCGALLHAAASVVWVVPVEAELSQVLQHGLEKRLEQVK